MAGNTVFYIRPGLEGLVASATLLVKSVGSLGDLLIAFIQFMAFTARLGIIVFIFSKRVMTVAARQSISVDIVMLFVLEDDIARGNFKLQPDWIAGCLGWKRRITQLLHL